jgi:hypothetical protein
VALGSAFASLKAEISAPAVEAGSSENQLLFLGAGREMTHSMVSMPTHHIVVGQPPGAKHASSVEIFQQDV